MLFGRQKSKGHIWCLHSSTEHRGTKQHSEGAGTQQQPRLEQHATPRERAKVIHCRDRGVFPRSLDVTVPQPSVGSTHTLRKRQAPVRIRGVRRRLLCPKQNSFSSRLLFRFCIEGHTQCHILQHFTLMILLYICSGFSLPRVMMTDELRRQISDHLACVHLMQAISGCCCL